MRAIVTKGQSHKPNQPVQHVVTVPGRTGRPVPGGTCRIEVICVTDGEPRVWVDDGHSFTEDRTPGTARAQALRNLALRDNEGLPVFYVRQPLTPWEGPMVDGERAIFDPLPIPLLDDNARARIDNNRRARAAFLEGAAGHAGLAGAAVDVAAVVSGSVETPAAKKAKKEKADGE